MTAEGRHLMLLLTADALAEHDDAETELQRTLSQFFDELPEDSVLLTSGLSSDEPGPHSWACEAAEGYGLRWVVYLRDGRRLDSNDEGASERRWAPGVATASEHGRALIEAASKSQRAGWQVQVVLAALPGREPGQASQTAALARQAGLTPVRIDIG